MNTRYLSITWSTSKGRDTYGYNICKLSAGYHGQVFRTCGGGYDMVGTVVGQYLQANYQERLLALGPLAYAAQYSQSTGYKSLSQGMYGGCYHASEIASKRKGSTICKMQRARISLDGACGLSTMQNIAKAIGLSLTATCNRRGQTTGYMVTDYGSAEALQAAQK